MTATYRGRLEAMGCVEITVSGPKIESVASIPDDPSLPHVLPPLVDLQQNGALGHYFTETAKADPRNLARIARHLRRHGVGKCQLTMTTAPVDVLTKSLELIDEILTQEKSVESLFFGVFHEGVFLSPRDGWRGAHPAQWLLRPDYDSIKALDEACGGRIRMVNVAPEEPGGLAFIERAVADGKIVSLGHCCPTAEIIDAAVDKGAAMVTHFGNGAAPMIHRFKNPFWAFLAKPELRLGLICDGFHLPPEVVKTALKCKGSANCLPISDASGYSGCEPGFYERDGGRNFEIREDGFLHLANSEVLMGAWFQLDRGVEFLVQNTEMTLSDAWRQCSVVPAKVMGIDLPNVEPGAEATFVLASWRDGLLIEQSVHAGEPYLDSPIRPVDV